MKRRSVFVVLAVIGVACSMTVISCKKNAEQQANSPKSTGNGELFKILSNSDELTFDFGNNVKLKLDLIHAGKFTMGSPKDERGRLPLDYEGPLHEITISKPFYMGIYHVTRGQFATFVDNKGYKTEAEKVGWSNAWDGSKFDKVKGASWKRPGFDQTDEHPVVCVSYNDAVAFCEWLSEKTSKNVKLPTEAQWEYACRAGTTTAYQWGNNPDDGKGWCNALDQTAKKNISDTWGIMTFFSWDDGYTFTSPVGKFKMNNFGLYDMHGNAWQWCSDWSDDNYYANSPKSDPEGPNNGKDRVLRGGSWAVVPVMCRSATRDGNDPGFHNDAIGFRVVVLPDEK